MWSIFTASPKSATCRQQQTAHAKLKRSLKIENYARARLKTKMKKTALLHQPRNPAGMLHLALPGEVAAPASLMHVHSAA